MALLPNRSAQQWWAGLPAPVRVELIVSAVVAALGTAVAARGLF